MMYVFLQLPSTMTGLTTEHDVQGVCACEAAECRRGGSGPWQCAQVPGRPSVAVHCPRLCQGTFLFLHCLTVWGVEPLVTHQTSCLKGIGICGVHLQCTIDILAYQCKPAEQANAHLTPKHTFKHWKPQHTNAHLIPQRMPYMHASHSRLHLRSKHRHQC